MQFFYKIWNASIGLKEERLERDDEQNRCGNKYDGREQGFISTGNKDLDDLLRNSRKQEKRNEASKSVSDLLNESIALLISYGHSRVMEYGVSFFLTALKSIETKTKLDGIGLLSVISEAFNYGVNNNWYCF